MAKGSFIDAIAREVNNARDQLYDMSEQLRTGQTVYDRTQQDSLHYHQSDQVQEQSEPEQQERNDMEQEY